MNENTLKNVIQNKILTNPYRLLSDLRDAFKPFQDENGDWHRISTTGMGNDLCHYNSGLYWLRLSVTSNHNESSQLFSVHFHIGNLDDMSFDAWSRLFDTKEEAESFRDEVAHTILPDLNVMPDDMVNHLNIELRKFQMFGEIY